MTAFPVPVEEVRALAADWALTVTGEPVAGVTATVLPVRTDAGNAAVLKVVRPHVEAEHEHLALRAWDGDGAVRLLRADPRRWALLLERLHDTDLTGTPPVDAAEVVAGLYARLHVPAPGWAPRLSELARDWSAGLLALPRDAPAPRRLVQQAAGLAAAFADDPGTDGTLVHTDLHDENVLAADRAPWLAIDPKPLSGDPHLEPATLLWNRWDEVAASGDVRAAVRARFHAAVDTAGLDQDRARDWAVVRMLVSVLWAVQDGTAGSAAGREAVTTAVTVAKAVQE